MRKDQSEQAEHCLQPKGWELMRQEIIQELNPAEWPEGTWCCWKSQGFIQARLLDPHWALLFGMWFPSLLLLWGCGRAQRWELSKHLAWVRGCAPLPPQLPGEDFAVPEVWYLCHVLVMLCPTGVNPARGFPHPIHQVSSTGPETPICLEGFQCRWGLVKFGICPSSPSQTRAQRLPKHCRCLWKWSSSFALI